MFDFGGVVDGYCSDFGRTVYCGEPPQDYLDAYDMMLAAYEAGQAAAKPGTRAREVNAACRAPIEDAGSASTSATGWATASAWTSTSGPSSRPRTRRRSSAGMTFTDEPSIIIPGRYSLRIENMIVVEEGGGRSLNSYPAALVVN